MHIKGTKSVPATLSLYADSILSVGSLRIMNLKCVLRTSSLSVSDAFSMETPLLTLPWICLRPVALDSRAPRRVSMTGFRLVQPAVEESEGEERTMVRVDRKGVEG